MNPLTKLLSAVGAIVDVANAWTDPGPIPAAHEKAKEDLRRDWPVLADALDRLTK